MMAHSRFETSKRTREQKSALECLSTVTTQLPSADRHSLVSFGIITKPSEKIVEDYDFLQIIGQGAFGTVFQATCKSSGDRVAIKYIKGSPAGLKEAYNLARVPPHPNIVRLIAIYLSDEAIFLVQELCSISLIDAAKKMSSKDVLAVLHQLTMVLQHLHAHSIIHRDIKPENIMLIKDGQSLMLKLIDFGLAVFDSDKTPNVHPAGTHLYMAPEMIRGTYDQKVDIWSFGMTACFLLCDEFPITPSLDSRRLYEQILNFNSQTIRFKTSFDESLLSIIRSFLNQDPELRPDASKTSFETAETVN